MAIGSNDHMVFIVGNSRSGTTLMMRTLNLHGQVHAINEPHFFEQRWSASDRGKVIAVQEAIHLASELLAVQRDGYLGPKDLDKHAPEARLIVADLDTTSLTREGVYAAFLHHETTRAGKRIPCEKTPQNVFYLNEILELFPNAKVINMVRDPRAVLLSQKRKWKRRQLGATFMTRRETWRLRLNYHPITMARLWNAALAAASRYANDPRFLHLRFEDLMEAPEANLRRLVEFLDLAFDPAMLEVSRTGSSSQADEPEQRGIRSDRANSWQQGGLNAAEIYLCQNVTQEFRLRFSYNGLEVRPAWWQLGIYYVLWPLKLGAALLVNLHRTKNLWESLKKRWVVR